MLLAAFEVPASGPDELTPLCPYIAATVEIHDPRHPASEYAREYKLAIAARLTETAREAGAADPTAAAIAAVLIDNPLRDGPDAETD